MESTTIHSSMFIAIGILIGAGLFFLSYWWIGTITFSAAIGLIIGGGIVLLKLLKNRYLKEVQ